jgi:uncharacterized membrane protein
MNWMRLAVSHILSLKRRWQGLIAGILLWVAWMIFGFWATLLLFVLAGIGFALGRVSEEQKSWKDIVDKLLSERYGDS